MKYLCSYAWLISKWPLGFSKTLQSQTWTFVKFTVDFISIMQNGDFISKKTFLLWNDFKDQNLVFFYCLQIVFGNSSQKCVPLRNFPCFNFCIIYRGPHSLTLKLPWRSRSMSLLSGSFFAKRPHTQNILVRDLDNLGLNQLSIGRKDTVPKNFFYCFSVGIFPGFTIFCSFW